MNRRSLITSLAGLIAAVGMAAPRTLLASASDADGNRNHECCDWCFYRAESIARENIQETGDSKLRLRDWSKRTMVVTQCGTAACEVRLASPSHHPYWEYQRRSLTPEEKASFQAEYEGLYRLVLLLGDSDERTVRGFILNGRHNGWNISTGPRM